MPIFRVDFYPDDDHVHPSKRIAADGMIVDDGSVLFLDSKDEESSVVVGAVAPGWMYVEKEADTLSGDDMDAALAELSSGPPAPPVVDASQLVIDPEVES